MVARQIPGRVLARVFQHFSVNEDSGCWEWTMSLGSHGYGQIGWGSKGSDRGATTAHRVAWEASQGKIPEGMTVDHLCRNRKCINPAHLRLLTNLENARDNGMSRKTHCPAGHPYVGENLYVGKTGGRRCRQCARDRRYRSHINSRYPLSHVKIIQQQKETQHG